MEEHLRPHRRFADRPSAAGTNPIQRVPIPHPTQVFRPLPPPTGPAPYHLTLDHILPPQQMQRIRDANRLVFHVVGDTGGVKSPEPQMLVVKHMQQDFASPDPAAHPAFFYNLGDVVYYYGEAKEYHSQFYEPNIHYPAPIFAIPGNHDGDVFDESVPTLAAFVDLFCSRAPHVPKEAGDAMRDTMTQPNVYWTLEAPFVTIIGLYSNVPEGGSFDDEQIAWFESEMVQASPDKALIIAVHHPIYSADSYHSGSAYIATILDRAFLKAGRKPDLVLTGHVHNYQRFTRIHDGYTIPYIVAGSGGYWHLHKVVHEPANNQTDATLESYCDDRHGYMRLEVTAQTIKGEFFTVPRPQESWSDPAVLYDSFTLDLKTHKLV